MTSESNVEKLFHPRIIYSHGKYYVWDRRSIEILRGTHRILGSFIGCTPGAPFQVNNLGLPLILSENECRLLIELHLATIYTLRLKSLESVSDRQNVYIEHTREVYKEANKKFQCDKRQQILKHATRQLTDEKELPSLSMAKMKVTLEYLPNQDCDYFNHNMVKFGDELQDRGGTLEGRTRIDANYTVFKDLWNKQLYIGTGLKFGCDFLAYQGDPLVYHSAYAIRVMTIDLMSVDSSVNHDTDAIYNYINSFQRLCHNTNKIPLFAFVSELHEVTYKTMNKKDILDVTMEVSNLLRHYLIPLRPTASGSESA